MGILDIAVIIFASIVLIGFLIFSIGGSNNLIARILSRTFFFFLMLWIVQNELLLLLFFLENLLILLESFLWSKSNAGNLQ